MKTEEFFDIELENIVENIRFYDVQVDENKEKYMNSPFPSKEYFLDCYEDATNDLVEELDDIEDYTEEEQMRMIDENKKIISEVYDRVERKRDDVGILKEVICEE